MTPAHDSKAILAFILQWIEEDKDLPAGSLSPDATFDELGLDSLTRMNLAGEIFDRHGCEFEASVMWDCQTPNAVVQALSAETASISLTTIAEGGSPHIVLIFGLGGTARDLFPITEGINQEGSLSVSAIEQPFSEDAQTDSAEETIDLIADTLFRKFGTEPVIPLGYSFGGLLAMGIAERLRAKGGVVPFTTLLDTQHPTSAHDPVSRTERVTTMVRHLPAWISESVLRAPSGHKIPGARRVKRELRHLGYALRGRRRLELREVIARNGRPSNWDARTEQNFNRMGSYYPKSHNGDLLVLRARTRPLDGSLNQADNGWGRVVQGEIHVKEIPGTHSTVLQPDRLRKAGVLLASALSKPNLDDIYNAAS